MGLALKADGATLADDSLSYRLIHKGREIQNDTDSTLSLLQVEDGDTIHVILRLSAAPCGPFAILEGKCTVCREKFFPHNPSLTIHKNLLAMRSWLHSHWEV